MGGEIVVDQGPTSRHPGVMRLHMTAMYATRCALRREPDHLSRVTMRVSGNGDVR